MRYIVVTQPHFHEGEAGRITLMFQAGLERLHLRKPGSAKDDCRALLEAISPCYHSRIVLHDHFSLLDEFALGGVHLNSRNRQVPAAIGDMDRAHRPTLTVSTSCHSIDELRDRRSGPYDYLTLSPIFDSISKQGYTAAFSREELLAAREEELIDGKVLALGGISGENMDEALSMGFGGVMVLGDAWRVQRPPIVLSIAGSDPSAGAGIQQDLKTMTRCGCYGTTVITAVTSQNTRGVQDVMPMPPQVVESQLRSIFSDLRVDAVKIGMIPNAAVARAIITVLKEERARRVLPVVCDPIMLSTSGTRLMAQDCIALVARELFPLCTLVTPNIPEARYLARHGLDINTNTLLKGGHAEGSDMTDTLHLIDEGTRLSFTALRIETHNLHGTGCTISSAIASHLAQGCPLAKATSAAKDCVTQGILGGRGLRIGHGNGPLYWARPDNDCTSLNA